MRLSVVRNLGILIAVTTLAVWLSYSNNDYCVYSIPIIIGIGVHLCTGTLLAKVGYIFAPMAVLAIWWLPTAFSAPDSEASGLMMWYLTIWLFGALLVFAAFVAGKFALQRHKAT